MYISDLWCAECGGAVCAGDLVIEVGSVRFCASCVRMVRLDESNLIRIRRSE